MNQYLPSRFGPIMTVVYSSTPPDIGYMPDHEKYLARSQRRQATENIDKKVPEGFPSQLTGSLVCDPNSLANPYNWNYHLTPEDIDEIKNALRQFKGMSLGILLKLFSIWRIWLTENLPSSIKQANGRALHGNISVA